MKLAALLCAGVLTCMLAAPASAMLCSTLPKIVCHIYTDAGKCVWSEEEKRCTVQAYDHNDEDTVSIAWIQGHMSKEDRLVGLSGSAAGTPVEESAKATHPRALLQVGEAIGEPECIDKPTPDRIPCENQKLFKTCGRSWMVQGGFCMKTCGMCQQQAVGGGAGQPAPALQPASTGTNDVVEVDSPGGLSPAMEVAQGPLGDGFCSLPADTGPCRASIRRWHWDASVRRCRLFIYGGCDGNTNNFGTLADCVRSSVRFCTARGVRAIARMDADIVARVEEPLALQAPLSSEFCALPAETGPCRGSIRAWYWDSKDGVCKQFMYGGCQGNANNFDSILECGTAARQYCGLSSPPDQSNRLVNTVANLVDERYGSNVVNLG